MNKNINKLVDNISEKFGYDEELNKVLKRIIPVMTEGKSEEINELLFNALDRVKIFTLNEQPTLDEVERCKQEVIGNVNKHVNFVEEDRGEYDNRGVAAGAYINEPTFDENMKLTGRKGLLYVDRLSKYNKLSEIYGTRIDIGHLIHELGHAWASEKEEFIQKENGDVVSKVGAYSNLMKIDKDKKQVEVVSYDGLFIEETLNTIEEERVLCKLLNIDSISEIRMAGYVPSNYQGMMTDIMKSYVEKFGQNRFDNFRFLKDSKALEDIEHALEETDGWKELKTQDYTDRKKAKFDRINELEVTGGAKRIINNVVETYYDDYFPDNTKFTPIQKLNNVCTQIYNFGIAKYNFGIIDSPKNLEIYKEIMTSMSLEGYVLKNQAKDLPKLENKEKQTDFLSQLKDSVKRDNEIQAENKEEKEQNEKSRSNKILQEDLEK